MRAFEERRLRHVVELGPGMVVAAFATAVALVGASLVEAVSPLVLAVVLGLVVGSFGVSAESWSPGLRFASRRLLRVGIVLVGFRLSLDEIAELGAPALATVLMVVTATFAGVWWMGRRLGMSNSLSILVASGFAICGASAVAAMQGVVEADDDEVSSAVLLVTLCGTLAVFALPAVNALAGLDATDFGTWAGASIHDVGQVVAAAATAGAVSLHAAIVVKLVRVLLLAPLVAIASAVRRARATAAPADRRPPFLPLFVVAFLASIAVRSTGVLDAAQLDTIRIVEVLLLAAALFALATGADLRRIRQLGPAPLLLAGGASVLVASVSFLAVRVVS